MKILVVLNNSTYGEYLSYQLAHDGHQVSRVKTGFEGLCALRQEPWDCLITGIVLSDMTGLEVIKQYRDDCAARPEDEKAPVPFRAASILVVTRIRSRKTRENAYALGVADYLLLPLKTALLIHKINQL